MFCAAASHPGALWRANERWDYEGRELQRVFGDSSAGGPDDIYALAEGLTPGRAPTLCPDCGTGDYLLESNRAFHAHLDRWGVEHEYAEFTGAHDWTYWDERVQETVLFFGGVWTDAGFGLSLATAYPNLVMTN